MAKSNPEQIAKVLLWNVSGLRAETASMKAQLDTCLDTLGKAPSKAFVQECIERDAETQKELYQEACKQAGLNTEPPAPLGGSFGSGASNN
jgi:hypothetical protein